MTHPCFCQIQTYLNAWAYYLLSFKAFSTFFSVCMDQLYTPSYYIVDQIWFGIHFRIHRRSHVLVFCRKPQLVSSQWLRQTNACHIFYIVGEYPVSKQWCGVQAILLFCWGTPRLNTVLSYTESSGINEIHFSLLHCWAIPNPNALLRYIPYL